MLKIKLTVRNTSTGETNTLTLPNANLNNIYNALTHKRTNELAVDSVNANFDFLASNSLNILGLNNLLTKVNALCDSQMEKVMDLYQMEEHTHSGLSIAYTSASHFEVVDADSAGCSDWNELKRRAGAVYMLGVCPDLLIVGDNLGLLSNEYRDAMFREGIRSKGILLIGKKFYVKDTYLLEAATDVDIDYYELEEKVYEE